MHDPPRKEAETARRIRAQGLAYGRGAPEIASEIHDQCAPVFGTSRVKAHRLALGNALSDVIAQVRALYEAEGKPQPKLGETLLSAYESGYKRPGPEYLHYLCNVYRVEPADLGYEGPCICGHGHAMPSRAAPAAPVLGSSMRDAPDVVVGSVVPPRADHQGIIRETPPVLHDPRVQYRAMDPASPDGGEEEDVLRRTLIQLLAGAGVAFDGQLLGAADNLRRRMDDTLVGASASPTMLDQWEETIIGYGQQYMSAPPLRLLCDVLLDFSEIRRLCEQRQPIELQERLCRIAAQLAGLSGILLIGLGDHRMARSFFRTAHTAADETGDRALRAWVAARETLVPMYYGDPRETLYLARKTQNLAGRTPSVAGAMAPILEARALSQLVHRGRSDALASAKRALERGRAVFADLPAHDQSDTAFGYTERQLLFHQGDVYVGLGDHKAGEPLLSRAQEAFTARERLNILVLFRRAHCQLLGGHPDEAIRLGQQALQEIPVEQRTAIVVQEGRRLASAVTRRHGELPAVREFREVLIGSSGNTPRAEV